MFAHTTGKWARVNGFACADGLHGISAMVTPVAGEQCSPLRCGLYQSLECVIHNGCPYHITWCAEVGAPYGIYCANDKTYAAQSKTSYMYHINEKMENETSAFILHYPFSILHYSTSTPLIRADSSPVSGMTRHFCPSTTSVWTFTALSCGMRTSMTVPVSHGTSSSSVSAAFAA